MLVKSNAPTSRPPRVALSCIAWGFMFSLAWLGYAQSASAEFFTFSTTLLTPASPVSLGGGVTVSLDPQSIDTPGDNIDASFPGTGIVFGSISVAGLTSANPASSIPITIPYTFRVSISNYLTDSDLVATGTTDFDVSGTLGGTVGAGKKVNITNVPTLPSILHTISGEDYLMDLFSYVPPGARSTNPGAFGAHVLVRVPEPSTLALLSFAALALATPAYRRWRRKTPRVSG